MGEICFTLNFLRFFPPTLHQRAQAFTVQKNLHMFTNTFVQSTCNSKTRQPDASLPSNLHHPAHLSSTHRNKVWWLTVTGTTCHWPVHPAHGLLYIPEPLMELLGKPSSSSSPPGTYTSIKRVTPFSSVIQRNLGLPGTRVLSHFHPLHHLSRGSSEQTHHWNTQSSHLDPGTHRLLNMLWCKFSITGLIIYLSDKNSLTSKHKLS